jgi:NhaP-type Na+/H+ or K+/H+ antiporter
VIPGFVVAAWGVVTGPVVVAEGTRALQAPMRSRELVRGSFRPVALFVFLAFVVSEAISTAAGALLDLLPQAWAQPTGEYVVHILTSPLFGMATAVLYYALVERERAQTRDEPAEAGPSSEM